MPNAMSPSESPLQSNVMIARLIWGSMLSSIFIYFGAAQSVLAVRPETAEAAAGNGLVTALFFAAVLPLLILPRIQKQIVRQAASKPQAGFAGADDLARARKCLTASVVGMAFAEAPGVYGIIAMQATRRMSALILFCLIAVLAMIIHFPSEEKWRRWLSE